MVKIIKRTYHHNGIPNNARLRECARMFRKNITSRVQQNFPTKRLSLPLQKYALNTRKKQSLVKENGKEGLRMSPPTSKTLISLF